MDIIGGIGLAFPESVCERILVVDDEESVRRAYQSHFAGAGFEVHSAASLQEAFELAIQHDPSIYQAREETLLTAGSLRQSTGLFDSTLQLEGSYGPGAGWNIRVEAEHPASFRLVMDHVYPPHGAYPVVIAEYRRP